MFIKKIELTNIKAYTHKVIEFAEGVNFISGRNGAGKTTIIESIGYGLFDYQFSNTRFYDTMVRKGEKEGLIRITFLDNDGEEFISNREVKKGGCWSIRKIANGEEVEVVSKSEEALAWVRTHLGFEADDNIEDIYSKIVSVPQGLMTTSFLLSSTLRKKEFDPVFNLEKYRQMYDNSRLETVFEKDITDTKERIKFLEGTIEKEDELKESEKTLKKDLETKQKEIDESAEADKEVVDVFTKMDAEKQEVEKINNDLKVKNTEKIRFENEKKRLEKEIEEANNAVNILEKNENGYKKYLQVSEEIDNDEAESKKLEAVLSEVQEKKKNVAQLKSSIEERTRHLSSIEKEIEKLKDKINAETVLLEGYKKNKAEHSSEGNVQDELDKFQRALKKLTEHEVNLKTVTEQITEALNNLNTSDKQVLYLNQASSKIEIIKDNVQGELQKLAIDALEAINNASQIAQSSSKGNLNSTELLKKKDEIIEGITHIAAYFKINSTDTVVIREQIEKLQSEAQTTQRNLAVEEAKLDKDIENKTKLIENYNKDIVSKQDQIKSESVEKEEWTKKIEEYQKEIDEHKEELSNKEKLDSEIEQKKNLKKTLQSVYDEYSKNIGKDEKLSELVKANDENNKGFDANKTDIEKMLARLDELNKTFDIDVYNNTKTLYDALKVAADYREKELKDIDTKLKDVKKELKEITATKKEIKKLTEEVDVYSNAVELVKKIRGVIKETPEYIAKMYVNKISKKAEEIYQRISSDSNRLAWGDDYSISLIDVFNGKEEVKEFGQLSGGEQMTAALSVRLAMLQLLTNLKIGILDEPTTNVDSIRRSLLAEQIEAISPDYNQIFVVSHDDTFDSCTSHVISLGG